MTDALDSAKAKLARANIHTATAKREVRRFFKRHPDPTFDIDMDGGPTETRPVGEIVVGRLVLKTGSPDLPISFGARFGDAIQNYRGVLDHIAWQLVAHGEMPQLEPRRASRVQFPIYDTESAFDDNVAVRLPGVSSAARGFIKARHGYAGGNATNNGLLALARLSNEDKHRTLHVFVGRFRTLQTEATFTNCQPLSWENPPIRPTLKEGAVVTRFSYLVTGPNHKVHMNLSPEAEVVVEPGIEFSSALEGIKREVTEILNAAEIIAAVS